MKKLFPILLRLAPAALGLALGQPAFAQGTVRTPPPPSAEHAGAAADAAFVLKVDAPTTHRGQKGVAKIHITPGAGYHMNKEYPTSLALSPPVGLTLDKAKLTSRDAAKWEEQGGEFDVAYTASQPGKKVVTGELKFAVCSANSCDPKRSSVSFEIDVK